MRAEQPGRHKQKGNMVIRIHNCDYINMLVPMKFPCTVCTDEVLLQSFKKLLCLCIFCAHRCKVIKNWKGMGGARSFCFMDQRWPVWTEVA